MSRPELVAPPEVYYNDDEAAKYTKNSRIQIIQCKMTERALELLNIGTDKHILDIGCGSGLSGEVLSEYNHTWVGMDIAPSMLGEALDRNVDGDLCLADMGQGIPFRAGSFDAAISISVIQWLGNADTAGADPKRRMKDFFETLFSALKRGGKVCCQFYPHSGEKQLESIMSAAKTAGFGGGVVVDNPESKKQKKYYLVLQAGANNDENDINLSGVTVDESARRKRKRGETESQKDYIMRKKDTMKKRGKAVARDSKYTARKRRPKF